MENENTDLKEALSQLKSNFSTIEAKIMDNIK